MILEVCMLLSVTCDPIPPVPQRKPMTMAQVVKFIDSHVADKPNPGLIRLSVNDLEMEDDEKDN